MGRSLALNQIFSSVFLVRFRVCKNRLLVSVMLPLCVGWLL